MSGITEEIEKRTEQEFRGEKLSYVYYATPNLHDDDCYYASVTSALDQVRLIRCTGLRK